MNFKVLYYLTNEKLTLVEVARTDLPSDTAKELVYHWLVLEGANQAKKLSFESMREEVINSNIINVRVFESAELRFDKLFGKFVLGDELFILQNSSEQPLPELVEVNVADYIKSLN